MEYINSIKSPVGMLTISSDGNSISGLWIEGQKYFGKNLKKENLKQNLPIFDIVKNWLNIYFSGKNPDFLPELSPIGTSFQESIWNILSRIPYGQTTTYGEIAKILENENEGKPTSARAVGNAIGHNPISILIPCHRVIGKKGELTGYAGGILKKKQLLQTEGINIV